MRYATEIAAALREIHEHGRAHGKVAAATVVIGPKGAELLPSRASWDQDGAAHDTREFGALVFHMLTGAPLRPGELHTPARSPGRRNNPAGLRESALRVAADCFKEGGQQPKMQQVLTELRLLTVLLKMPDKGLHPESPAAPAPFLVEPIHFPLRRAGTPPLTPMPRVPQTPAAAAVPDPNAQAGETGATPLVPLGPKAFGEPGPNHQKEEVSPRGGPCPKCDCSTVYTSRARSRFEMWLTRIRVPICRCHSCYHRYFVFSQLKIAKQMPVGIESKKRPHRRKR
ncbi:MAG: hypothetical protein JWP63_3627 [Candidatus Solibacter sp.]|nr:hypothetical protein [Candidatus Solibacter sp.]